MSWEPLEYVTGADRARRRQRRASMSMEQLEAADVAEAIEDARHGPSLAVLEALPERTGGYVPSSTAATLVRVARRRDVYLDRLLADRFASTFERAETARRCKHFSAVVAGLYDAAIDPRSRARGVLSPVLLWTADRLAEDGSETRH